MKKGWLPKHIMFNEIEDVADVSTFERKRKHWIRCVVEEMTKLHVKRDE